MDLSHEIREQLGALLRRNKRCGKAVDDFRRHVALSLHLQAGNAEAVERCGAGRDDLLERTARRDEIEARHVGEGYLLRIHPNAADPALAPNRHLAIGAAHNDRNVAGAVDRAEQNDRGAGKTGCDRNQMTGQISGKSLGTRGRGPWHYQHQKEEAPTPESNRRPGPAHSFSEAMEYRSAGRTVRSKTSFAATANTIRASNKRSWSPRRRVPN